MVPATARICLFACLLMRVAGPGGLVICFGGDGHIALEPAWNGRCTESVERSPCAAGATNVDGQRIGKDQCCQNCFDMGIGIEVSDYLHRAVATMARGVSGQLAVLCTASPHPAVNDDPVDRDHHPPPGGQYTLREFATMVLIC